MATPISQPIDHDLVVYQGTDHEWAFRRVTADGTPVIPTAARAQIRSRHGGDVWATLDSTAATGPRATIDPDTGWVTLVLPHADTEDAAWDGRRSGVWDLEVTAAGLRRRWVQGAVTVSQEVTRDA